MHRHARDAHRQILDREGHAGEGKRTVDGLRHLSRAVEELLGDGSIVALLLLADPAAPAVLADARRVTPLGVEPLAAHLVPGQLSDPAGLEGGDLPDLGTGTVEHHGEVAAHLLLERGELTDQGGPLHGEPAAVDPRQGDRLEELVAGGGEDRHSLGAGQVADLLEVGLDPAQVGEHRLVFRPVEPEPVEALLRRPDPVLDLDAVLPVGPVPGLELEVAAHDRVLPAGEPRELLQLLLDDAWRGHGHAFRLDQKKTGSR